MNPESNIRLAVIGATGAVGDLVCQQLSRRQFPYQSIRFFGSPGRQQAERVIRFSGTDYPVEALEPDSLRDIDLAIASTPDDVAARCAPWITDQGGIIVDESAVHRMRDDVPLVIPEVNSHALRDHRGIIASPNCSTTQLVVCLQPIHLAFGIKRVVVSTYQAASGAGNAARSEFIQGTRAALDGLEFANQQFESPLPMNLWPKIGGMRANGHTSEEVKMVQESRKILGIPDLRMAVTCVRVPVENCHSESVVVETSRPASAGQVRELLGDSPGIRIVDDPEMLQLPTPQNCNDRDDVFVGRIRRDESVDNGFAFWCVSDNLRKGAATNAVQIAESLLEQGLIG